MPPSGQDRRVQETTPPSDGSSPLVAITAVVAGLAGAGLLVFGLIRLVDGLLSDDGSSSVAAPTTTEIIAIPPTSTTVTTASTPTEPPVFDPGAFVTVSDDTGTVSISYPAEWTDRSGAEWSVEGEAVGLSVAAAPDRDAWYAGWGTPGAFVGVATVGPDVYVPELGDFSGACTLGATENREYEAASVVIQQWTECGDEGSEFYVVLLWPETFAYTALMQVVVTDSRGWELIDLFATTLSYQP